MAEKVHAYIEYAIAQEQGSFCDAESGYHYDNVSALKAAEIESGLDSTHIDRDGSDESESLEQRHNVFYSEHDSHSNPYPAKYRPGK
jgi:hypothetical protein